MKLVYVFCLILLSSAFVSGANKVDGKDEDSESKRNEEKQQLLFLVFIIVTVAGLLANIIVFFVIFCGDEIGEFKLNEVVMKRSRVTVVDVYVVNEATTR